MRVGKRRKWLILQVPVQPSNDWKSACRWFDSAPGHQAFTPNPLWLGVLLWGLRDTTRGSAPICMCHAVAARRPEITRFDSLLLSVLSKPGPTSSRQHTQAALSVNDLHVRHGQRLSNVPGW